MIKNKFLMGTVSVLAAITLSACGDEEAERSPADSGAEVEVDDGIEDDGFEDGHPGMDHSSTGEIPFGLQIENEPAFELGSLATLEADHMPGMDGAEATIVGAYDTVAYSVTYTPSTGGEPVEDHKWIVHEELENPDAAPLSVGDEVVVTAGHMEGMEGAEAVIESVEDTTVYMVDFISMDGQEVFNHQWVIESELSEQ